MVMVVVVVRAVGIEFKVELFVVVLVVFDVDFIVDNADEIAEDDDDELWDLVGVGLLWYLTVILWELEVVLLELVVILLELVVILLELVMIFWELVVVLRDLVVVILKLVMILLELVVVLTVRVAEDLKSDVDEDFFLVTTISVVTAPGGFFSEK